MSPRVLLVDSDPDALADAAAALRRRGYYVQIANDQASAEERVRSSSFDVVVAPDRLLSRSAETPGTRAPVRIVSDGDGHDERDGEVAGDKNPRGTSGLRMSDAASVIAGVEAVVHAESPDGARDRDGTRRRGSGTLPAAALAVDGPAEHAQLADAPLDRFLTHLATSRASGIVAIQPGSSAGGGGTSYGTLGEIRLREGEVIDARYGRHTAVKAMARLLALRDGRYVFRRDTQLHLDAGAEGNARGRGAEPDLFRVARQRAIDAAHLRQLLSARGGGVFAVNEARAQATVGEAIELTPDRLSAPARIVFERLRTPTALDELLEEPSLSDDAILGALLDLEAAGRIVRLAGASARVAAFDDEERADLAEKIRRAPLMGYEPPLRVVFAATPGRLGGIAHALGRFAESLPLPPPSMLVAPYPLARLALVDRVALDLVALPLVPAYAPLWPLYLAGAHAVVVLDEAARQALDAVCDERGIPRVEAARPLGSTGSLAPEDITVSLVASLIRRALDR